MFWVAGAASRQDRTADEVVVPLGAALAIPLEINIKARASTSAKTIRRATTPEEFLLIRETFLSFLFQQTSINEMSAKGRYSVVAAKRVRAILLFFILYIHFTTKARDFPELPVKRRSQSDAASAGSDRSGTSQKAPRPKSPELSPARWAQTLSSIDKRLRQRDTTPHSPSLAARQSILRALPQYISGKKNWKAYAFSDADKNARYNYAWLSTFTVSKRARGVLTGRQIIGYTYTEFMRALS
jgi:hypothetical protein